MMNLQNPEVYTQTDGDRLVRSRKHETKIGEQCAYATSAESWEKELNESPCRFVLLGIPEDIGVKANYGRGGAHTAWKPALESFLNQQSNAFLDGKSVFVLGHVFVDDLMESASALSTKTAKDIEALRKLVSELDGRVSDVIERIVKSGKIPVIVGGGHNNAYPIIKGCSKAKASAVNVINCDPHSDYRPLEGRHSGNGFSYAREENYLSRYSVFGLHEQYNTAQVLCDFSKQNSHLFYTSYEDIFIRESKTFSGALDHNIGFVKDAACGVEIDLDAITNVPSSAKTSSGISPVQGRQYAYRCGRQLNALYFHIAEGAPVLSHIKADNKTGKLIAYLITDFMKGVMEKDPHHGGTEI
jgi:formiminoglutamase